MFIKTRFTFLKIEEEIESTPSLNSVSRGEDSQWMMDSPDQSESDPTDEMQSMTSIKKFSSAFEKTVDNALDNPLHLLPNWLRTGEPEF